MLSDAFFLEDIPLDKDRNVGEGSRGENKM